MTSFSSAFLHIGRCCARQNALLQVLQFVPAARGGSLEADVWVESGMMVLLVKQVHLQKDGGAVGCEIVPFGFGGRLTGC